MSSRRYRVVRLKNADWLRWAVVSVSLRGDETWDVLQEFVTRGEAFAYVGEVQSRNQLLEQIAPDQGINVVPLCSNNGLSGPGDAANAPGPGRLTDGVIDMHDAKPGVRQ